MIWPNKAKYQNTYQFPEYLRKEGDWFWTHPLPPELAKKFTIAIGRFRAYRGWTVTNEKLPEVDGESFFVTLVAKHRKREYV